MEDHHWTKRSEALQEYLDALYAWADVNNMEFNGLKFELITFGKFNKRNYKSSSGTPITRKETLKDLGIHLGSTCEFSVHIHNAVKATTRMANWALRIFRSRDRHVMRTLLKSIVIPKIEYRSSPTNNRQINLIEDIQRRFTSRITEFQTLGMPICTVDYWERHKS